VPRASREQREVHHERILTEAARLVRELGPDGVTVPGVMAAAGLTPGGFYKHFESKDDLLAQAGDAAVRARAEKLARLVEADPTTARERFLDTYLSPAHRDHPGRGCPTAALAVDVGRPGAADAVRDRYTDGVRELVGTLATLRDDDEPAALADLATMVGALLLARATAGDELSERFLTAARARLADPS
jgi:TetR/AcrR family transcriptional repressor of nem operon